MSNRYFGRVTGFCLALVLLVTLASSDYASAAGGSWGSSRGGFGSGGGLLGGRTPIRSLLGGIGNRLSNFGSRNYGFGSGGSGGFGSGGSGGFGSGGSRGFGSSGGLFNNGGLLGLGIGPRIRNSLGGFRGGGSAGSTGGLGSTGGWGSGGGLAYSGGYSNPVYVQPTVNYGCTGGLYSGSATADYYGDWGTNYLQGAPISTGIGSAVAIDSYDISSYNQTGLNYDSIESVYGGGIGSGVIYDSSAIPMAAPLSMETDFTAPMLDYGAVPTLPTDGMILPQMGDQTIMTPDAGTMFGPVDGSESSPSGDSGFGPGLPDAPTPDGEDEDINSTRRSTPNRTTQLASMSLRHRSLRPVLTRAGTREAVLGISVPKDAKVFINGKLTATPGTLREYVSRKLKSGKTYSYQVKAVIERAGESIVRSKLVRIETGTSKLVEFDFTRPQLTKLVLKVPADAKVLLDGQETKATGNTRVFSTEKLTNEQSWKDYHVEVSYQVAGKQVVRKQSLTLTAGATEVLDFNAGAKISGAQVASK